LRKEEVKSMRRVSAAIPMVIALGLVLVASVWPASRAFAGDTGVLPSLIPGVALSDQELGQLYGRGVDLLGLEGSFSRIERLQGEDFNEWLYERNARRSSATAAVDISDVRLGLVNSARGAGQMARTQAKLRAAAALDLKLARPARPDIQISRPARPEIIPIRFGIGEGSTVREGTFESLGDSVFSKF
jgi:hypothetical protein